VQSARTGVLGAAVVLILLSSSRASEAQLTTAGARKSAIEHRDRREFAKAISFLRTVVASPDATVEDELMLAETLAWNNELGEAAQRYRHLLDRSQPPGRARLGLARVLLWSGRYAEARQQFATLEGPDALEGTATAAYWQGDYTTALREFRRVLQIDPAREFAAKSVREIEATMIPSQRVEVTATRDDQPFEAALGQLTAAGFIDPLTGWNISAGSWRLHRPFDDRTSTAPRVMAGLERAFPWQRLTLSASAGAIRLPGGETEPIGNLTLATRWGKSTFSASFGQREILTNPAEKYAMVRSTTLEWKRDDGNGRSAAAHVERLDYSDRNNGLLAYAYGIVPVFRRGLFRLWTGLSAAHRDTDDTRFFATSVSSTLQPAGGFAYTYRGLYIPYWTPEDLTEARGILGGEMKWSNGGSFRAQLDGGQARDKGIAFAPNAGIDPLPSIIVPFAFARDYEPFRARMDLTTPTFAGLALTAGYEYSRTIDYESRTVHAAVVRRR
jgi:tetratricopeptide (TPR) repeat protein